MFDDSMMTFIDFHRHFHKPCRLLQQEVDIAMRASQLAKGFARNVQQACQEPKELGEMESQGTEIDGY